MEELSKFKLRLLNLLLLLFLVTGLFVIFTGQHTSRVKITQYEDTFFNKGWYYYDYYGEKVYISSLPAHIPADGMRATIYHEINPIEDERISICFYSQHQSITFKLNDKVFYNYKSVAIPRVIKSYHPVYNFAVLPEFPEHSVICIETEAAIQSTAGEFEEILLGDSTQVLFSIFFKHINSFLLGVMFIVTSLFLLGSYHLFSHSNIKDFTLFDLALLTFTIGLWQLDDSTLLLFFTGYLPLLWCLRYLTQLFMPVFTFLFMKSIAVKKECPFIKVFYWVVFGTVLLQFTLQFTGIQAITNTLYMSHLIYLISCIYVLSSLLREDWLKPSKLKYFFLFSMIISIAIFAFTGLSLFHNVFINSLMSFGLAFTFISMILITYQKELKLFETVSKAETYKTLAFIDIATGVYNKTAWFTLVDNFNEHTRPQGEYCLIVFDMNHLKKLNDNYGHLIGDTVIKAFCDCLVSVVRDTGKIYRIGGDEFVCVCHGLYRENIMSILHRFDEAVKNQPETEHKFSAAYGYEFFTPKSPADFKKALERADEKMYEMKVEMKATRD